MYTLSEKTTNIYNLPAHDYKKLLHEKVTRIFKKSPKSLVKPINLESNEIAAGIKLDDRIEYMETIITLEHHKDKFTSGHSCRLINA